MAKTFKQIQDQIAKLQAQALVLRQSELNGVIAKIRVAIVHYGLTREDLFPAISDRKSMKTPGKARLPGSSKAKGRKVAVKYRDGANTWTGRGNKPRWLVARLAEGRQIGDFAI